MKNITKYKSTAKAIAGSALLVGATLTGAAGAALAQDSGSSADLENPFRSNGFVAEDGTVDSSIVVGESAATIDVVGAINVAGAMSQDAYSEESVSVSAGAAGSWSAENGITLNRQNSNIYFPQSTSEEKTRLDEQDVPALETATVQSEDNEEVEIEHDLVVGTQQQKFDAQAGDLDDPALYVEATDSPSVGTDYLLQGSVSFDSTMDFTVQDTGSADGNAEEVLEDGDEITLFGQEYTYSSETDDDELVLYGSSERFEVDTGESTTVTVDGEEHTFEAQYVSDATSPTATVTVDGSTESVADGDTITVSGTEVRVADIYRTGADGQGRVAFSIGSQEVVITDGSVEVDGDTVDGVDVSVNSNQADGGVMEAVNSIDFAFGAQDSDSNYVAAGETYETPVFGLEFHYGGLNPDASTEEGTAGTLELDAQEDGTNTLSVTTAEGEELEVPLAEATGTSAQSDAFGTEEGTIAQFEGQEITEDDYVVLNAFEESAMMQVTSVDDTDLEDGDSDGSISVTLENVATGDTVEVEEDGEDFSGMSEYTVDSESVEGMDYDINFHGSDDVSFVRASADGDRQVWPGLYTQSDAVTAFDSDQDDTNGDNAADDAGVESDGDVDLTEVFSVSNDDFKRSLNSAVTPNSNTVDIDLTDASGQAKSVSGTKTVRLYNQTGAEVGSADFNSNSSVSGISVTDGDDVHEVSLRGVNGEFNINVSSGGGGTTESTGYGAVDEERTVELPSTVVSNDATATVSFTGTDTVAEVAGPNQPFVTYSLEVNSEEIDLAGRDASQSAALVVQPENDNDEEESYVLETDTSEENGANIDYSESAYSGVLQSADMDDEDVTVGYDEYGAYSEYDFEDSDNPSLTLNMPAGQSTAGMAVTGTDGELSASASSSDSATSMSPAGFPDVGALDSDSSISQAKQEENLVLVGGPAVNSLTQELADANKTMTADEYEQGTGMVQLVPDAFTEGNHALVVAGYAGEDTRYAANYLADHEDNAEELAGQTQVDLTTGTSTS